MGRFTLAVGYVLTGDPRYLTEYHQSFNQRPLQPPPSKEWLQLIRQTNADKPYKPKRKASK